MRGVSVLVLCLLATNAWANRVAVGAGSSAPLPCWNEPAVFPADGTRDVPLNAHAYVVAGTLGDYRLRGALGERRVQAKRLDPAGIVEITLGALEPNHAYQLLYGDATLTTFTTGSTPDTTGPELDYRALELQSVDYQTFA